MFKQKILGIVLVIILAGAGGVIFNTGCYDDSEARVTIHLERNDLAGNSLHNDKRIIDRVLEFFSTPAEASTTGWDGEHGPLTLTVSGTNIDPMTFSIPQTANKYSVVVPVANNIKFVIISTTTLKDVNKNWGGELNFNTVPGDNNITLTLLPMTEMIGAGGSTHLTVTWWDYDMSTLVTTYNIYRSTNPEGPYVKIAERARGISSYDDLETSTISNIRLYYRISVNTSYGEGIMCDYVSGIR